MEVLRGYVVNLKTPEINLVQVGKGKVETKKMIEGERIRGK